MLLSYYLFHYPDSQELALQVRTAGHPPNPNHPVAFYQTMRFSTRCPPTASPTNQAATGNASGCLCLSCLMEQLPI